MREYGQVQCAFWQHASENQWSSDAMLLAVYLMTGPHSNGVGAYRLPEGYIQDDLGWVSERVKETLSELLRKGFCERFGTVIVMPKFLRWNPISNGNVAKARAAEFEAIPSDAAKVSAARALLTYGNHWEKGFANRLETLSKGYANQNPTQPNPEPTQPERESTTVDLSPAAPDDTHPPPDDDAGADDDAGEGSDPPGAPPCPAKRIVALYHEVLPELPPIRDLPEQTAKCLRARWRSSTERQSLDWWRRFFGYVRGSPFLMGEKTDWQADLLWLVRPTNFAKVLNGNYDQRAK